jgi:hypothetical protein
MSGWSWRYRRRRSPVFYALTHDNADSDPEHDLALDDQPAHDDHAIGTLGQSGRQKTSNLSRRSRWIQSGRQKTSDLQIAVDHHFDEKRILQDSRDGLLPNRTIKSIRLKVDLDVEEVSIAIWILIMI